MLEEGRAGWVPTKTTNANGSHFLAPATLELEEGKRYTHPRSRNSISGSFGKSGLSGSLPDRGFDSYLSLTSDQLAAIPKVFVKADQGILKYLDEWIEVCLEVWLFDTLSFDVFDSVTIP